MDHPWSSRAGALLVLFTLFFGTSFGFAKSFSSHPQARNAGHDEFIPLTNRPKAPITFDRTLCDPFAFQVTSAYNSTNQVVTAMFQEYDRELSPIKWLRQMEPGQLGPLVVYTQIIIENVFDVNQRAQDFKMIYDMQLAWRDCRLAFTAFSLDSEDVIEELSLDPAEIWSPSMVVEKRRASDDDITFAFSVETGSSYSSVLSFGLVMLNMRLQHKIRCTFDFSDFPRDAQRGCGPTFRMFTEDIHLTVFGMLTKESVVPPNVNPPEFNLLNFRGEIGVATIYTTIDHFDYTVNKSLSTMSVLFDFDRISYYWMVFTVIPVVFLWIVSYVGFYIDPLQAPARATLGSISILSLVTLNAAVMQSLPPINYPTTLSIYVLCTMGLCALHLMIYGIVNYAMRQAKLLREEEYKRQAEAAALEADEFSDHNASVNDKATFGVSTSIPSVSAGASPNIVRRLVANVRLTLVEPMYQHMPWRKTRIMEICSSLDHYSRWLAPLAFAIVTGVVWGVS